jgi:hypothetical protein
MSDTGTEIERMVLEERVEYLEERLDVTEEAYFALVAKLPVLVREIEQDSIRNIVEAADEQAALSNELHDAVFSGDFDEVYELLTGDSR